MKRLFKHAFFQYLAAHRVGFISTFSLVYPLVAALVRNALWRKLDTFFNDMYGPVAFLEYLGIFLGPPLALFILLPYGRFRRAATAVLYILCMVPLSSLFQHLTYCYFNPLCSRY